MPLISTMRGRDPANSVPDDRPDQAVGFHGDAHQRQVFGRAVVHGLGDVDAVVAGGDGGVDHVDAFHQRRHQAGQHRGCQRAVVQRGGLAFIFDGDLADRPFTRLGQLAGEPAEQAAEFQVWFAGGARPRRRRRPC